MAIPTRKKMDIVNLLTPMESIAWEMVNFPGLFAAALIYSAPCKMSRTASRAGRTGMMAIESLRQRKRSDVLLVRSSVMCSV